MKSTFFLCLVYLIFHCNVSVAQETCATAIPIAISGTVAGDNSGAMPDIDYSVSTGCVPGLYNSSHWYTITMGASTSSVNLTFTPGTITNATITIIDDCSSAGSFSYLWFECNANGISGVPQIICDLTPTGIYYIQVSSAAVDEGTFTLAVDPDFSAPPNDVCETAIVLFGGELDCGEFDFPVGAGPNACPDYSYGGNCFPVGTPGVWYTFSTPVDMPYGSFSINPVPAEFELYSTTSD